MKLDVLENWLSSVSYSHSQSKETEGLYRRSFEKFLSFIGGTPEDIEREYAASTDRVFKRKYAQYLRAFAAEMQKRGYSPKTISVTLGIIKSFFKHSDFPLGYVPSGSNLIAFHNREISKYEIVEILKLANVRDRAFFTVMAQSGLRPQTITNLKIKDVEGIANIETLIPSKIRVRQENTKGAYQEYFSFIGPEAVEALRNYLKTKTGELTPDSYIFTKFGHEDKSVSAGVLSHVFGNIVLKLREKGILDFETKTRKIEGSKRSKFSISELRLYGLRKWFRKNAGFAGVDFVSFWMGHSLGVDEHYFSRDPEHHRKIYQEKAMPHLRLETATPSETDKLMAKLSQENKELKRQIAELNEKFAVAGLVREQMKKIADGVKKWQEEKRELESKIAGIENFQKLILDQSDDVILEFIRDIRRQLKEQRG